MAFKFKRHSTPFGQIIHKRGPAGTNLLVTKNGQMLRLNFSKLLKTVRLKVVNGRERISFTAAIHPKHIGKGEHGTVFRVFSAEVKQGSKTNHVPSVILKVYHSDNPLHGKPDGFTQFFSNTAVFNFLKKQQMKHATIRPLHTYFVSERFLVRKYLNAPTFEEARIALVGIQSKKIPLSEALTNKQIYRFLEKNKITLEELDRADRELVDLFYEGSRKNFNVKPPIEPDAIWRNFFVIGKDPTGKLIVSIIDQGKNLIPNIGNRIRKGTLFRQ